MTGHSAHAVLVCTCGLGLVLFPSSKTVTSLFDYILSCCWPSVHYRRKLWRTNRLHEWKISQPLWYINSLKSSGHYMYRTVVTICTTSLTLTNSTFCPHSVFVCFVWISEQTAIISLYSINWLVFIAEMECVYCAVRTGSLYIIPYI